MADYWIQYPSDGGLSTDGPPAVLPAVSVAVRALSIFDHTGDLLATFERAAEHASFDVEVVPER